MKSLQVILLALTSTAAVFAQESVADWHPPTNGEMRGPCPGLNTLANHGYLPRDGKNITVDNAIRGLGDALNFNATLSAALWGGAMQIINALDPTSSTEAFTLEQLRKHNIVEHDASLTRADYYFDNENWYSLNRTVYDFTRQFWTDETVDATMLTKGWAARHAQSKATNPTYQLPDQIQQISLAELQAPLSALGNFPILTVNRTWLEYFFENERLPAELGWKRPGYQLQVEDVLSTVETMAGIAQGLAGNATQSNGTAGAVSRRSNRPLGFHGL